MSDNPARQEQDSTDNNAVIGDAENHSPIEMLEKESQEFCDPYTITSILDLVNKDFDFHKFTLNSIHQRLLQSISSRTLELSRYHEAIGAIYKLKMESISSSMARFTSPQSTTSTKPEQNTNTSEDTSESQSSTTQSKSVFPVGSYRIEKSLRESQNSADTKESTG
jgi:hypothetical protein